MSELDAIFDYPLDFPIKVMGRAHPDFAPQMCALVSRHAPDFDSATLESRASREGTYVSLTLTIRAVNREQLDAIYRELTDHPMVSMAL